jgi:ABC-2 type transport system ATP-binding protein
VTVRSPDLGALAPALQALGATVTPADDAIVVRGATAEQIGDAAHATGVRLHQLTTLEATGLSEEFRGTHERGTDQAQGERP